MQNINYELYVYGEEGLVHKFTSIWQFTEKEIIFFKSGTTKRSFVINQITHDITEDEQHIVRLNCQEKKAY